jgi:sugar (pentulose or hexulose) kinase
MQIRADIFNKKMLCLEHNESGTLGCMILTATALGEYDTIKNAVEKVIKIKETYQPDFKNHEIYKEKYEMYKKLYELMHGFR